MMGNTCVAMVLAGGRGQRLGALTDYQPTPTLSFGGGYCLIDFVLSNCIHSGIAHVGILSQYLSDRLHKHVQAFHAPHAQTTFSMLPPRSVEYNGTADALYLNLRYLQQLAPEHVLILPSTHVYRMDYEGMLRQHIQTQADVTVAATPAAWLDAQPLALLRLDGAGRVTGIDTSSKGGGEDLASMEICLIRWPVLHKALMRDHCSFTSKHDLAADVLPQLIRRRYRVLPHTFAHYWRDIRTPRCLWQSNMDLLHDATAAELTASAQTLFSTKDAAIPPITLGSGRTHQCILHGSNFIHGHVENSVLSNCSIGKGAKIIDSVVMPFACIGENTTICRTIVGTGANIAPGVTLDARSAQGGVYDPAAPRQANGIALVSPYAKVQPCSGGLQEIRLAM